MLFCYYESTEKKHTKWEEKVISFHVCPALIYSLQRVAADWAVDQCCVSDMNSYGCTTSCLMRYTRTVMSADPHIPVLP